MDWRGRLGRRIAHAALALTCAVGLVACGGSDGSGGSTGSPGTPPPTSAPAPTVGPAGGTVSHASGAAVVVPAGALQSDVTVRIAVDSTGAPPLPANLGATGSVFAVTPHGATFQQPVEVRIPLPGTTLQPTQEFKIAKASPGGEWEILGDSEGRDGMLVAKVDSFSYFSGVVVTYLLPLAQLEPLRLTSQTLECEGQDCQKVVGEIRPTYTVVGNGGQLPANCSATRISLGADPFGFPALQAFSVPVPLAGGSYSHLFSESHPSNGLVFGAGLRCNQTSYSGIVRLGAREARRLVVGYPGIGLIRFPEVLDVVVDRSARIDALLMGAAAARIGGNSVAYSSPTETNRALIDWQRSDDSGGSWRTIARSFQNEADPLPADAKSRVPWHYWGIHHGFTARTEDQGALYRLVACYTPPDVAPPPCVTSGPVRINVLQQSALPAIVDAPRSVLVRTGETASFSVTAGGAPAPALQWQTRPANSSAEWTDIAGATAATHTTAALALADNGRQYRVVATNAVGRAESAPVTASVSDIDVAPTFTTQPAALSVVAGSDAVFAAVARGTEALSYQWLFNGTPIAGANSPMLRLPKATSAQSGDYRLVVSNAAGTVTSAPALLLVTAGTAPAVAPTIVTPPVATRVHVGDTVSFAVGVGGTAPFTFQWLRNGQPIAGATAAVYTIASVAESDAATYSVQVSNAAGSVASAGAVLTVQTIAQPSPVSITTQPSPQLQPPGGSATFAVGVTGAAPITFQWSKDGAPLAGQTQAVLTLANLSSNDAGSYRVTVANSLGSVTSDAAVLTILGAPTIQQQPAAASAVEGQTASFSVGAAGSMLRYQWTRNGVAIAGATTASYVTPALTLADSGAQFAVVVYNGAGLAMSQPATLTVAPAPLAKAWTAASLIAGGGYMLDPATGVDGTGRALAVWTNYPVSGGAGRVQFSAGTTAGWSAPAIIDTGLVNGYETRLAVAGNGTAVAAWGYSIGGTYHIAAAHFDGAAWAAAARVDTSQTSNSTDHALATDDQGRGVLAWSQPVAGNYRIHASISAAGAWGAPVLFDRGATAGLPAVAVNGQGKGFVVFNESSDTVVAIPVDTGAGFGTAEVIRAKGRPVGSVRVTVDSLGNALALWIDGTLDGDRLRYARYVAGAGWTAPADIDAIGWPSDSNWTLAGSSNGDAVVAWSVRGIDGREAVHLRRFQPTSGWGPAERMSTDGRYAETPLVAVNSSGQIVVTWIQSDPSDSLYQVWGRVHDGVWRDAQLLQAPGVEGRIDWQRGLAIAASGSAVSLWREWAVDGTEPLMSAFWP